ncbi:MAG TPA: class B sortase [Candidatus Limiplasma sp.]|nr:class B sortase [Candidatus Limiplasma sp.]
MIQFTQALAINPDTVGQLEAGESISTYVVQRDNSYYLRHSFYGEYSFSGAIFMDVSCSIYPQSRNLIIHGHNMQNGTSFGKLSRFESVDYLNKYPIIYFSTLYESAEYRPFAVVYYSIDPESEDYLDIYQINYLSDQGFIEFVRTVQLRSVYHIPVSIAKTDQILTLTTCATDDPDMRFAVFAVKIIE